MHRYYRLIARSIAEPDMHTDLQGFLTRTYPAASRAQCCSKYKLFGATAKDPPLLLRTRGSHAQILFNQADLHGGGDVTLPAFLLSFYGSGSGRENGRGVGGGELSSPPNKEEGSEAS